MIHPFGRSAEQPSSRDVIAAAGSTRDLWEVEVERGGGPSWWRSRSSSASTTNTRLERVVAWSTAARSCHAVGARYRSISVASASKRTGGPPGWRRWTARPAGRIAPSPLSDAAGWAQCSLIVVRCTMPRSSLLQFGLSETQTSIGVSSREAGSAPISLTPPPTSAAPRPPPASRSMRERRVVRPRGRFWLRRRKSAREAISRAAATSATAAVRGAFRRRAARGDRLHLVDHIGTCGRRAERPARARAPARRGVAVESAS